MSKLVKGKVDKILDRMVTETMQAVGRAYKRSDDQSEIRIESTLDVRGNFAGDSSGELSIVANNLDDLAGGPETVVVEGPAYERGWSAKGDGTLAMSVSILVHRPAGAGDFDVEN